MNRFLIGVLLGGLLGAAVSYVAFSDSASSETIPPLAAGPESVPNRTVRSESATTLASAPATGVERQVAKSLPIEASFSKGRIESLLKRTEVPRVEAQLGKSEITGRVTDPEGAGIEGVVIRASLRQRGPRVRDSESLGVAAPELSLEKTVESAAASFAKSRAEMREAETDAGGEYRLEKLVDASYSLSAYKNGYWITSTGRNSSVLAGGQLQFIAHPIVSVPIQVLMPGGGEAEDAAIVYEGDGEGRRGLDPLAWTPERSVLRLPVGKCTLKAVSGLFAGGGRGDVDEATLKSTSQEVEILAQGQGQTLVFQLEGQLGIRGRVTAASSADVGNLRIQMLPIGEASEVDLKLLAASNHSEWARVGSEFAFMNLEPGRYALGVRRNWNGLIESHRVVEVSTGIVDCDLVLPEIDLTQYLVVDVTGPDGAGLTGVNFQFGHETNGGSSRSGLQPALKEKGHYVLGIPSDSHQLYYGDGETSAKFTLRVEHNDFGTKVVALERGQNQVSVSFGNPAQLVAKLPGYEKSSISGRASIHVTRLSTDGQSEVRSRQRSGGDVSATGVKDFGNLEPGRYRLTLSVSPKGGDRWNTTTLSTLDIDLRTGPNEFRVPIPDLYSLSIEIVGGLEAGLYLGVPSDAAEGRPDTSSWLSTDSDGRAVFEDLLPGEYELSTSIGNKNKNQRVTVPSGVLRVDPETWM